MPDVKVQAYDHLIRLVRIAKGLESSGIYNAAKLYWAAAFSQEIHASHHQKIPSAGDVLDREMETAITTLQATGAKPELVAALQCGRKAAKENRRTIPRSEIPEVSVCRDCGEIILGRPSQGCPSCGARPLTPEQALEALKTAPDEIEHVVSGLSEQQMAQRPRPGSWAIRDVLAHLLVAQGLLIGRVEQMLAEENPSLRSVARSRTRGRRGGIGALNPRPLSSFEATVSRLQKLSLQEWHRTGQHEEFGQVTILQQASYFTKHERYHLPRMESTRRAIEAQTA